MYESESGSSQPAASSLPPSKKRRVFSSFEAPDSADENSSPTGTFARASSSHPGNGASGSKPSWLLEFRRYLDDDMVTISGGEDIVHRQWWSWGVSARLRNS